MKKYNVIGMDVHKKMIYYCVMNQSGEKLNEGKVCSLRSDIRAWVKELRKQARRTPLLFGMESTMFSAWIYDYLRSQRCQVKVAHPYMLKAISAPKKKSDKIDARTLANLLRADLFPECHMLAKDIRELRRALRYRNLVKRESKRMKNRVASLLMEVGEEYESKRLHQAGYFHDLMDNLKVTPTSVKNLLGLGRESIEHFEKTQHWILRELAKHPLLWERIKLLQSIAGVGQITALTWALEIGDPHRFRTVKQAISYCGLCSGQHESAGHSVRMPLSKQRNKYIQWVLIEIANVAPTHNPQLKVVHEKALKAGANKNEATLAVARKLVAYLLYVDKNNKEFQMHDIAV